MDSLFDIIARASTRRDAVKTIGGLLVGAVLASITDQRTAQALSCGNCTPEQCCNTVTGQCVANCPSGGCCSGGNCFAKCPSGTCCDSSFGFDVCVPNAACSFCCNTVLGKCVNRCPNSGCCNNLTADNACYAVCPNGTHCDDSNGHGYCVTNIVS